MKAISLKQLLSWLLGMIILVMVTNIVLEKIQANLRTSYDPTIYYWMKFILYFLIGAYLAFIVLKLDIRKSNLVAVFVLLISLIFIGIASLLPLMTVIGSIPSFGYELIDLSHSGWPAIIGGFLFLSSFILINKSAKTTKRSI